MKKLNSTLAVSLLCGLLLSPAFAEPFADGDPKAGKALHDKHCLSCHVGIAGGDGSKIYTRDNRKIKSAKALASQVSACNSNSGAGLFPEDETHIAAYLNQQFYKFK